ncbi:S8 family serine peptidase [Anaerobacillus sp. MEB173]|uniref:S8 family serine peptidase n=1 Tax=Anaerobacillus sp. MEB173 TaxID=3383345 RepID=UPI003F8E0985
MKIKILLFSTIMVIASLTMNTSLGLASQFPERPPVPVEKSDEEKIVIVEVEDNPSEVMERVQKLIPEGEVRKMFTFLFSGFSYKVKEKDIDKLAAVSGVTRVDEVVTYQATIDDSVPFIGGEKIWKELDSNGEHLTGKGVTVAVIDTGIDYNHPDLKKSYKGGYDLIDEDDDPMETVAGQGMATLHGTHVAGIIAANGKIRGVAPEAKILAYRALGPGGHGTTEQVIAAIERAVADGADVINLSLGNTVNGPDWPTSTALDRAVEQGVIAVTSNGNSGPKMWTVGSPGTSTKAISVGASSPPLKVPYLTIDRSEDKEFSLQLLRGSKPWTIKRDFPLVNCGLGRENECTDVEGKVALIKRGIIPFSTKAKNAESNGAKAVLIYNNTEGEFVGTLDADGINIPVASLSNEDGEWLLEQMEKKDLFLKTFYRQEEDLLAPFSSRGPVTFTWEVKPDVVAPGVDIHSTVPKGYLGLNGTSMAAPHVAGAAALIKQAHPDWTPQQVKAALMNTATLITDRNGDVYPPHEQGAGRIQVNKAVTADTLVYPGAVTFGKMLRSDERQEKEIQLTVENQSDQEVTYYIEPPFVVPDGVQWKVPFSFTLKPKEKKNITVEIDIMPSVLSTGIHNGEILVKGGKEDLHIPYLFFIEEPDYPRLMAFNFDFGDQPETYRYEMYLPGGAEEVGIALYDPDTFQFIKYLDVKKNVERGLLEVEIDQEKLDEGVYKALIFAKKDGKEDTFETTLYIGLPELKHSMEGQQELIK